MALERKTATFSFAQGVDTKTDAFQLPIGKLTILENAIFTKSKALIKRPGYKKITRLPDPSFTFLSTFSNDLIAIGDTFQSYSSASQQWTSHGLFNACQLSTLSCIRTATNQTQCDSVTAPSGMTCITYTDQNPSNLSQTIFLYSIVDSNTGVTIVPPTQITAADSTYGIPKVFLLSSWFVIVFVSPLVAGHYQIKYFGVSIANPTTATTPQLIATSHTPSANVAFDGIVWNNAVYLAWNFSGIHMAYITNQLGTSNVINPDAVHNGTIVSMQAQSVFLSLNYIWVTYYDSGTSNGYSLAVDPALNIILNPTQVISSVTVKNITSTYLGGTLSIFYEVANTYSWSNSPATNYISSVTITNSGTVGSPAVLARSVGLASKAIIYSQLHGAYVTYFLAVYQSTFQSTYFLMNGTGQVIAKLAYQNGCGYVTKSLPNVSIQNKTIFISYLYKFAIQPVNKLQGETTGSGIQQTGFFAQQGINQVQFNFSTNNIFAAELGHNLHVTGGFLWAYDGNTLAEQNFHLWPDLDTGTGNSVNSSSNSLSFVSTGGSIASSANLYYIGVYEWQDAQGNLHRSGVSIQSIFNKQDFTLYTFTVTSANATVGAVYSNNSQNFRVTATIAAGTTLICTGSGAPAASGTLTKVSGTGDATITFSSVSSAATSTNTMTIHFPTLRLTYKPVNTVKLTVYRASDNQPTFYQVTQIATPVLNSTTADSVDITDTFSDAQIVGNNILYTTGGVLENTGGQACNAIDVYDNRLFTVSSENPNVLNYSQIVLDQTPVEMSLFLTRYISPTVGAEGSTGPNRCLAVMDDKQVMLKDQALIYMNGVGPTGTGQNSNYSEPYFITSTVGCDNDNSIVFSPMGLIFQATNQLGFWLLTRDLNTKYIGADVEAYNDQTCLSANVVPGTTYILFTMSSGITLMYDYFYQEWGVFRGVTAYSSTVYQGLHTYIDNLGNVLQQTPGVYLDGSRPILMKIRTGWLNLNGVQGLQKTWWMFLLGKYQTPHFINTQIAYDYNINPSQALNLPPQNTTTKYGQDTPYGNSAVYGGFSPLEQFRINFAKPKCQSVQITMQEVYNPALGIPPGAGLTFSAATIVFGSKKGYPRVSASASVG